MFRGDRARAQSKGPKPQNVLSPAGALSRLKEGNRRYVAGLSRRHDFVHEREALAGGQNPYAAILGCADSRISPELAFDSGRGDLFVVRVAGNFAADEGIASLEYAVANLNTPLIVVLGHEACGAVSAAVKSIGDGQTLPGRLPRLVDGLRPAVATASRQGGDAVANATLANIRLTAEKLKSASEIISSHVADGRVAIRGAIYRLKTGEVEFVV